MEVNRSLLLAAIILGLGLILLVVGTTLMPGAGVLDCEDELKCEAWKNGNLLFRILFCF